jgi:rare lipoprotein A
MHLQIKYGLGALSLGLLLSGCGVVGGKDRPKSAEIMAPVLAPELAPEPINPEDNMAYDDVGYAEWIDGRAAGQPTAAGEPFNPAAISGGHATLPIPSYVEVTHLKTGKTILVRINDRIPAGSQSLVSLSPHAMRLLGAEDGSTPVRVRRVNPIDQERSALRAGQMGGARLDTPESLLIALRRKLAGSSAHAPATALPRQQAPRTGARAPGAPAPRQTARKPSPRPPGANYEQPPQGAEQAEEASPSSPESGDQNGEFVVEQAGRARARAAQPRATSPGGYFVQIGAFSDRRRAEALARQAGGSVQAAGSVWRVRVGPYANEDAARAAQRAMVAKGYRDARVTH